MPAFPFVECIGRCRTESQFQALTTWGRTNVEQSQALCHCPLLKCLTAWGEPTSLGRDSTLSHHHMSKLLLGLGHCHGVSPWRHPGCFLEPAMHNQTTFKASKVDVRCYVNPHKNVMEPLVVRYSVQIGRCMNLHRFVSWDCATSFAVAEHFLVLTKWYTCSCLEIQRACRTMCLHLYLLSIGTLKYLRTCSPWSMMRLHKNTTEDALESVVIGTILHKHSILLVKSIIIFTSLLKGSYFCGCQVLYLGL